MSKSFRDPDGYVEQVDGKIFRFINESGKKQLATLFNSSIVKELIEQNKLISYSFPRADRSVLEHRRISFPSYPYEWAPEMLHAAGELTLELSESLLKEELGLKDATPYNVLFEGSRPIFIDFLSVEKRDSADPIWLPLAQFHRMFLLPLLLNRHTGIALADLFITHSAEGVSVEEAARYVTGLRKFRPSFFFLVTLPHWLSRKANDGIYQQKRLNNPKLAQYIVSSLYKRTKKWLKILEPKSGASLWTNYMGQKGHYADDSFQKKEAAITRWLNDLKPQNVLDVGCNTGHFSALAASHGASVVAIDSDESSVGIVWKKKHPQILPLRVNLCRPTPSIGWKNQECRSFLERAKDYFDAALFLAVIHHMLVTERVPLEEIASLCSDLTTRSLIIEFVATTDPMFKKLVRGRDELYAHLTISHFREVFSHYFEIQEEVVLMETRTLFLMKRK